VVEMKRYSVKLYYSGFITKEIEADTPEDAIIRSRKAEEFYGNETAYYDAYREVLNTLEPWRDADTAEEIE
jgi:hypothetical protein